MRGKPTCLVAPWAVRWNLPVSFRAKWKGQRPRRHIQDIHRASHAQRYMSKRHLCRWAWNSYWGRRQSWLQFWMPRCSRQLQNGRREIEPQVLQEEQSRTSNYRIRGRDCGDDILHHTLCQGPCHSFDFELSRSVQCRLVQPIDMIRIVVIQLLVFEDPWPLKDWGPLDTVFW